MSPILQLPAPYRNMWRSHNIGIFIYFKILELNLQNLRRTYNDNNTLDHFVSDTSVYPFEELTRSPCLYC
jgi:hypothetical protein